MVLTSEAKLSLEYSSLTLEMAPVEDQVMSWLEAASHSSPPSGSVRVTVRSVRMEKSAFDRSLTSASLASLMRTLTVEEGSSGMVQAYVPSSGVEATMVLTSLEKPSFEYSSLTLVMSPVEDQVMSWLVVASHSSPLLGAVRVRVRSVSREKSESDRSLTSASLASLMRTFTVVEGSSGMVQA